jgi:hypothetical protein
MKRLVIGAAAAGGAAFAHHRLARRGRELRDRCREMMRGQGGGPNAACQPG